MKRWSVCASLGAGLNPDHHRLREDLMSRSTLALSVSTLGIAVWLAARVVDTQPAVALVVIPVVLIFGALAAHPSRS
jgi:hypothetical protein